MQSLDLQMQQVAGELREEILEAQRDTKQRLKDVEVAFYTSL